LDLVVVDFGWYYWLYYGVMVYDEVDDYWMVVDGYGLFDGRVDVFGLVVV